MKQDVHVLKLHVTYCGGCNPDIDRKCLVERLFELLQSEGIPFCPVPDVEMADLVLIVNGCAHACKEEKLQLTPAAFPFISVQGKRLDYVDMPEEQIPEVLLDKIRSLPRDST